MRSRATRYQRIAIEPTIKRTLGDPPLTQDLALLQASLAIGHEQCADCLGIKSSAIMHESPPGRCCVHNNHLPEGLFWYLRCVGSTLYGRPIFLWGRPLWSADFLFGQAMLGLIQMS